MLAFPAHFAAPEVHVPSAPTTGARGTASYYDDGPGLYAAVHSYKWGDPRYPVRVCYESRCVTVTVRDYCQCYVGTSDERIIDLSPQAFARLAPLGLGLIKVTVRR
jgi:hypothetical protein